jgi:hypothetical protein
MRHWPSRNCHFRFIDLLELLYALTDTRPLLRLLYFAALLV